jgi:thiosulfate/3-mercaptopyruvate sulfurtransferase
MTELNWTYEEFLCFVLIYISHSDMEFTDAERLNIVQKSGNEVFQKQIEFFDDVNDFQALNIILQYKAKYFANEDQIQVLLNDVKDQFLTDGYTDVEKEIERFLEKIIRTNGF